MTDITLAADAWEGVDAQTEALVDSWLVQPGDAVLQGQPLANVVLIKTNQEVLAPANGHIGQILVAAGDTFARGQALATLKETP